MSKATGVFLVLAGLGTAALVLPAVDREAERQLSDIVRVALGPQVATEPRTANAPDSIASDVRPNNAVLAAPPTRQHEKPVTTNPIVTGSIDAVEARSASTTPKLLVTSSVAVTAPAPTAASTSLTELTKAIQDELRRVGCYSGAVTGEWSEPTRKAMRQFVERVNATLPVDQPDHILKMLVQGHPGNACGEASCPSGQKISTSGRCLPNAVVAQRPTLLPRRAATQKAELAESKSASSETSVRSAAANADGHRNAVAQAPTTSSWSTSVAQVNDLPVVAPTPLPGRMSVGAPRPSSSESSPQPGPALSRADEQKATPTTQRAAVKPASARTEKDELRDTANEAAEPKPVAPEKKARKVRAARDNTHSPPPPSVRYGYGSSNYTSARMPRRFGVHIFADQRWAR